MKSKSFAVVLLATALAAPPAFAGQQGGVRRPPAGGGGGSGGDRGGSSGGGDRGGSSGAVRREAPPPPSSGGGDHASRPASPSSDHAVPRTERSRPGRPIYVYRNPWPWYYDPWYGSGIGVGYAYYSPWNWYGPGWGPGYGYGYGRGGYAYDGKIRLKVEPRDAEVYVDGYYAGIVDDFDGTFQGLRLNPGGYKVEVRKPGFETLTYDVRVQSDRTITFHGEMRAAP